MKKSLLFIVTLVMTAFITKAQGTYNVVIFSEDGDAFIAYINGVKQNEKPETNVKATGLTSEALSLRVEFDNKALPKLKQNMMPEAGYEHTVKIRRNTKKEIKLQYFGKTPLGEGSSVASGNGSNSKDRLNVAEESNNNESANYNTGNGSGSNTQVNTNTQVNSTSTNVQTGGNPQNGNVSISMNVGAAGTSINMNIQDNTVPANGDVKTSSSVNTGTTSTSYTTSSVTKTSGTVKNPYPDANATTQPVSNNGGCVTMSPASYQKMKESVNSKPFSDTKMSTAKLATKNNCLTVEQIKGICKLFSMDEDKLTYAKYAYDYCSEKGNYYQVGDVFSFSATTEELNQFLESK